LGESSAVTACSLTIKCGGRTLLCGHRSSGYNPRRFTGELLKQEGLAGGEDYGYFASNAGDAGSNPAAGICARVV